MRWFHSLTLREKLLISGAIPIGIIAMVISFVWIPLGTSRDAAIADIAAYRLVTDTTRLAEQVADQTAKQPINPAPLDPLATRITRSADTASITLRRVEPDGNGLRVTLDETPFATLIVWLADMEQVAAVTVTAIEIDRRPTPGIVTARILLEDL